MMGLKGRFAAVGLATLALFAVPAPAQQYAPQPDYVVSSQDRALESRLREISAMSSGRVGILAQEIGGTRQAGVNVEQTFPMASTVKIAIAAAYLKGVDEGRYRLDASYPLLISTGKSDDQGRVMVREGMSLTAQSLIELMITKSDNQATDALLHAIGGPRAVNTWLTQAGISGQRVDRNIATLLRDDLQKIDPVRGLDKRDTSTPQAMVRLLAALDRGEVLSPQSRAVLIGAMSRCLTGKTRIPGQLPAGTMVAHKTGTLWAQTSDVGIIRMPDGRKVALAVFVTGQESHAAQAQVIAAAARAVYDSYAGFGYEQSYTARR